VTADEEPNFALVDDPVPPEPDVARLQRAVARGRQRLFRRRAMLGALAASIAFVLIGGGVAVAGRNDSAPDVQVNPPTTVPQTSANVRDVDENGVHYTLTLETPVVTAGQQVRVSLRGENHTTHSVSRSQCDFQVVVAQPDPPPPLFVENTCARGDTPVAAGATFQQTVGDAAPAAPGDYSVRTEPTAVNELPDGLIRAEPFALEVLPSGGPTPTASSTTSSSQPLLPTPTEAFTVPTAVGGAQGEDPRTPHADDFSGSLTASATSVAVGHGVDVELNIRNTTDHQVEPSLGSLSKSVAIVCARDLSPLGHTGTELRRNVNLFFVTSPPLAAGESSGRGSTFTPTNADVGTVTCAGVIVATTGHWEDGTISGMAQLANVPSVSFTVAPASPETTTSAAENPTTSTTTGGGTP
jgi:hypothetical protein